MQYIKYTAFDPLYRFRYLVDQSVRMLFRESRLLWFDVPLDSKRDIKLTMTCKTWNHNYPPSVSKIQFVPKAAVLFGSLSPQGNSCMLVLRLYGDGLMDRSRFLLYRTLSCICIRRLPGGYALRWWALLCSVLLLSGAITSRCLPTLGTVFGCRAGDTSFSIDIGPNIFSNFNVVFPDCWYIRLFLSKSLSLDRILLL